MTQPRNHTVRPGLFAAIAAAMIAALLAFAPAALAASPKWEMEAQGASTSTPSPSTLTYAVFFQNRGDADAQGALEQLEFSGTLPAGMTVQSAFGFLSWDCSTLSPGSQSFTCTDNADTVPTETNDPSGFSLMFVTIEVDSGIAEGTVLTPSFEIKGGGEGARASVLVPTRVTSQAPEFGINAFDSQSEAADGSPFTQAGGHMDEITTMLDFNTYVDPAPLKGSRWPVEPVKEVVVDIPPGLIANPSAMGKCTTLELSHNDGTPPAPLCPAGSQVGTATVRFGSNLGFAFPLSPVFNMVPGPGEPARFGFNVGGEVIILSAALRSDSDYGISVLSSRTPQAVPVNSSTVTLWNDPSDPSHDADRACPGEMRPWEGGPRCPAGTQGPPFLRLPTSCAGPLQFNAHSASWWHPGRADAFGLPDLSDPNWKSRSILSHKLPGYPASPEDPSTPWGAPEGLTGCEKVPVRGTLSAEPTSDNAETGSGLVVHVEVPNPGMENVHGISSSDIKRVRLALPQGMTINPSQAEGLGVCSPAQYESSELSFHPDGTTGCPPESKVGTVSVKTPLLEEPLEGSVYVAKPFDNPFNSLLALYIVVESPERGILVKLPGKLTLNETTGRIEAEFDDIPQQPFSSFDFRFKEGARAPLVTPPTCRTYTTTTEIEGWSDPAHPITTTSSFQIDHGIGGGPCPPNSTPAFKPGFSAGSINNNAASHTAFNMRITRNDGEQDMTRFSATLPPGVLGKLAGVAKCPNSAIAIAKSKSGTQEQQSPSCPANSEIGRSIVGAGVGSVLTYVPGKVYLGGPFNGRPLSVIAITPVVAGPFDVGTVAVHEALTLNPKTAEVEVDGSASDPIPHILKGIPAKLRDLRVYVDRPEFVLNPTSCDPSATDAELFGGGGNAFTSSDDVPVLLADRFQAANCAALGFKPKLALKLKGGTKRGGHPALQATYRPRKSDANVEGLVVRLPRSAFLDQAHIRTICTRVQFAADKCPKGAQYGYIKAWTPLLEEPLEGPVWLRSSNHKLPDLVFDLHGLVDVEVATRIDSVRGGVRASVEDVPDAPLSKVVLRMQGAKKGLIINSRNLCTSTNRANVQSDGHNGKVRDFNPLMRPECGGKRKGKRR